MKLNFWASTDVGQVRDHNEDNYLVDKKLNLFIVCDGMGGHAAGEVASAVCVRSVQETLASHLPVYESFKKDVSNITRRKAVSLVVENAIEMANTKIWRMATEDANRRGMGTTCSLILIINGVGFVGHVGDSRIYLQRESKIQQLTSDHSLVNEMLRLGKIKPGEEDSVPHKNAVTRAVGVSERVDVDTFEVDLKIGDGVLLCSDGLSGYLEDPNEMLQLMMGQNPKNITEKSIRIANESGGKDNITSISIHCEPDSDRHTGNLLQQSSVFQYLTPNEIAQIYRIAKVERFEAQEIICKKDQDPERLFLLLSGSALIEIDSTILREGSLFGEFAVIQQHQMRYSVIAQSKVQTLTILRSDFMKLMKEAPALTVKVLWNFLQRYEKMTCDLPAIDWIEVESEITEDSDVDEDIRRTIDASVILRETIPPSPQAVKKVNPTQSQSQNTNRGISGESSIKQTTGASIEIDGTIEIDIHDEFYEEIT